MEQSFFWYINTLLLNQILIEDKEFKDHASFTLKSCDVKDKYFIYLIEMDGALYKCIYTFHSNVCILGTLQIIDIQKGKSYIFDLERFNECIRIFSSLSNYHEIHFYQEDTLFDIHIQDKRKTSISVLTISKLNEKEKQYDGTILRTDAISNRFKELNNIVEKVMFVVSGAVDYEETICFDVVQFNAPKLQMILYAEYNSQIICINRYNEDMVSGIIQVLNTDFKQSFYWKKDDLDQIQISENIPMKQKDPITRRLYTLRETSDHNIVILEKNKTFSVKIRENHLVFSLQK